LIAFGVAVLNWPNPTLADECDAKVAALEGQEEGATVVGKRTEAGGITLKDPFATEVAIECAIPGDGSLDLYLNWDGAFPPPTFYEFAGRAGHIVLDAPANTIREGAIKCQQAALRASNEISSLTFGGISFECQAFIRDGGGTAITIYRRNREMQK
jgi:hypothetical protein